MRKHYMMFCVLLGVIHLLSACGTGTKRSGALYPPGANPSQLQCGGVEPGKTGTLVADTGFRPRPNGFSFANYGGGYRKANLSPEAAWKIFGETACKRMKQEECVPTPALKLWVKTMNEAMGQGHCEGMATLSAWMFLAQDKLAAYGKPTAFDLDTTQADLLQDIAFYWTLQTLEPVVSEFNAFQQQPPSEILKTLISTMQQKTDWYTLGIYGSVGGHAVTPYAVEDVGNGVYWIHVYDNNYPCAYKYVEVDTNTETWRYAGAAINPAEDASPWSGTTGTMDLTSLSVRQQSMECPFCSEAQRCLQNAGLSVLVNGRGANIRATNAEGKQLSLQNGQAQNEIPGAKLLKLKGIFGEDRASFLLLPPNSKYALDLGGTADVEEKNASVAMFTSCEGYALSGMSLSSGQISQIMMTDKGRFSYLAGGTQSPTFEAAFHNPDGNDTFYSISDFDIGDGRSISFEQDEDTGEIYIQDDDPEMEDFDLDIFTIDTEGEVEGISYKNIDVEDEGQVILHFDDDENFELYIDSDGDGISDSPPYEKSNESPDWDNYGYDDADVSESSGGSFDNNNADDSDSETTYSINYAPSYESEWVDDYASEAISEKYEENDSDHSDDGDWDNNDDDDDSDDGDLDNDNGSDYDNGSDTGSNDSGSDGSASDPDSSGSDSSDGSDSGY